MNPSFTEIENKDPPKLKNLHFLVHYTFKNVAKLFPSVASYMVFVGKSRSGKSSLITYFLTNRECIEMRSIIF